MLGLDDFDRYIAEHDIPPERTTRPRSPSGSLRRQGGPVPRFEKVERELPADGIVIEGDDL